MAPKRQRHTVLVANVGTRDLALDIGDRERPWRVTLDNRQDGEWARQFLGSGAGTRAMATALRERFEELAERLALPILGPSLDLALEKLGALDCVLLFATDQPADAGSHRDWDTIESARLIEALLPRHYGERVGSVEIVPVRFNPSEHERMYEFVGGVLRQRCPPEEISTLFACIKGGVPAANAALRTHAVNLYGVRAWLVETEEPPAEARSEGTVGQARLVDTWPFRRDTIARLVRVLIRRYDYEGVRHLLEAEGVRHASLEAYLRHAQARLNLDFDGAAEALAGLEDGWTSAWKRSAQDAHGSARLAELAAAARIFLDRGDFVGFLARVASFCEACRRRLVEATTGLRLGQVLDLSAVPDNTRRLELAKALGKRKDVKRVPGPPDRWFVSRDLFNVVLQWADIDDATRESVKQVQAWLGRLGPLEQLRHDTLHEEQGISWSDLKQRMRNPQSAFAEVAGQVVGALASLGAAGGDGPAGPSNVYDAINAAILEVFESLDAEARRP